MIFEKEEEAVGSYSNNTNNFVINFFASDLMWQSGLELLLLLFLCVCVCMRMPTYVSDDFHCSAWYHIETKLYVLRNCTLLNGTLHQWPVVKFTTWYCATVVKVKWKSIDFTNNWCYIHLLLIVCLWNCLGSFLASLPFCVHGAFTFITLHGPWIIVCPATYTVLVPFNI